MTTGPHRPTPPLTISNPQSNTCSLSRCRIAPTGSSRISGSTIHRRRRRAHRRRDGRTFRNESSCPRMTDIIRQRSTLPNRGKLGIVAPLIGAFPLPVLLSWLIYLLCVANRKTCCPWRCWSPLNNRSLMSDQAYQHDTPRWTTSNYALREWAFPARFLPYPTESLPHRSGEAGVGNTSASSQSRQGESSGVDHRVRCPKTSFVLPKKPVATNVAK